MSDCFWAKKDACKRLRTSASGRSLSENGFRKNSELFCCGFRETRVFGFRKRAQSNSETHQLSTRFVPRVPAAPEEEARPPQMSGSAPVELLSVPSLFA